MSDRLDVMELMRRANPTRRAEVPDPSERELRVMEEIIRSSVVPPRISDLQSSRSRPRFVTDVWGSRLRGPAVALVAFVVVVAVGVTLRLIAPGGSGNGDPAAQAGPITNPLTVGVLWESAMNRGDLDGLMALYADDVAWAGDDKAALRQFLGGRMAFNAQYEVTDCRRQANSVTCRWNSTDDLAAAAGVETITGSLTFAIHNGFIQLFITPVSAESAADWERVLGFFDWLARNHPELSPQVYDGRPEGDQLRSRLVTEWLALGVVEEWQRAINQGDLEAFMALYAEDARWGDVDKAGIGDFFGWRIGLNAQYEVTDCQVEGDTVTCRWTASDDFFQAAGVDSLTGSMTFTIRNGLAIEQFDGPTSPETTADWNRVLGEFDTWVQATHPELPDDERHGFVTFTAEAAELHLRLVEEWMATR